MKFLITLCVALFATVSFAGTVNDMTFKNQFGETTIADILTVASAGGTAIGAAIPAATITGKALTGFSAGAGTVSATDTILQGFNKLAGNTQNLPVISNVLTGYTSAPGTISASDSILSAIQKLNGNDPVAVSCTAGAGGGATEALTCTGLAATDTILAVFQVTPGANSLPLLGYSTLGTDTITGIWSADPGAGAVVRVTVKKN